MVRSIDLDWVRYSTHVIAVVILVWVFALEIRFQNFMDDTEEWSKHIADQIVSVENKANLKYEADLKTLEMMFDMIYKLKTLEEENND